MSHLLTKLTKRPLSAQRRLRSAWTSAQSSLCAQWVTQDPRLLHADSEVSDQSGWMPRLICAGRKCHLLFCHKVAEIVKIFRLIFITEKRNIYLLFFSFSALTRNNVWKINLTSLRFFFQLWSCPIAAKFTVNPKFSLGIFALLSKMLTPSVRYFAHLLSPLKNARQGWHCSPSRIM